MRKTFIGMIVVALAMGTIVVPTSRAAGHDTLRLPSPFGGLEDGQPYTPPQAPPVSRSACPKGGKLVVDGVDGPYFDIQSAIDDAQPGDTIKVEAGTYSGFSVVNGSCLTIEGTNPQSVVISGSVLGVFDPPRGPYDVTAFIHNSTDIRLNKMTFAGAALDDAVIWYASSTGEVAHCDVSGTFDTPGSPSPATGILILGVGQASNVRVRHTDVHDFGKIGITVHSFNFPGTVGRIEHCNITGRVLDNPNRVQDGIQALWGAHAMIRMSRIKDCNNGSGAPTWASNGILIAEASADVLDTRIENCFEGIYAASYGYIATPVLYARNNKIEHNTDVGLILEGTDDNTLVEHTLIRDNEYGLWQGNWYGVLTDVVANLAHCDLRNNNGIDLIQDPWAGNVTLNLNRVKYGTYFEFPGGAGSANLNVIRAGGSGGNEAASALESEGRNGAPSVLGVAPSTGDQDSTRNVERRRVRNDLRRR